MRWLIGKVISRLLLLIKKLVLKNVPPWRKAVVAQNKNSITNIYHTQILALLLKVCYNIKVTLNFNGYNTSGYCRKNYIKEFIPIYMGNMYRIKIDKKNR